MQQIYVTYTMIIKNSQQACGYMGSGDTVDISIIVQLHLEVALYPGLPMFLPDFLRETLKTWEGLGTRLVWK